MSDPRDDGTGDAPARDPDSVPETPFVGPQWRVSVSHVGERLDREVVASDEICVWVTDEMAVSACTSMICKMDIRPTRRGRFDVKLRVRAELVQDCVITLEPFNVHLDEHADVEFWPEHQISAWTADLGKEMEFDDETPDPEPIVDDVLDVGALVREVLLIAIDQHPRKPDASFGELSTETEAERAAERPFAALAKLRDPDGSAS